MTLRRRRTTLLLALLVCTRGGLLVQSEYRHLADAAKAPREGWGKVGIPSERSVAAAPELTMLVAVPALGGRWIEAFASCARSAGTPQRLALVSGSRSPPSTS